MKHFRNNREHLELGPFTLNYSVVNLGENGFSPHSRSGGAFSPPFHNHLDPPSNFYSSRPNSDSDWPYRCNNCPNVAKLFCPRCEAVGYCSEGHLMDDEISHRLHCNPEKNFTQVLRSSETHEVVGMRSTNNLSAGEAVCRVRPLLMAPHDKSLPGPPNSALCFGCAKWYPEGSFQCSACSWPVCSVQCEANSLHSTYECEIFNGLGVAPPNLEYLYDIILTLRCILMLENSNNDEPIWQSYMDFNGFKTCASNEHSVKPIPPQIQTVAEDFILKVCRLNFTFERNGTEMVRQVLSYVLNNSLCQENRVSICDSNRIRNYHSAKYIFPYKFAYNHHCNPNTNWTIDYAPNMRDTNLHIWATRPLSIGDKLSICFDQTFAEFGTHERRQLQTFHFQRSCNCSRCSDPTELGSMASAVKCQKCEEGYIVPLQPLDDDSMWKCGNENCAQEISSDAIFNRFDSIAKEIKTAGDCVASLLATIRKLPDVLHPQHFLIARAADRIVEIGWLDIKSREFETMDTYNFKPYMEAAGICLSFADAVSPGLTRHRAKYIYALQMMHGIQEAHNAAFHFSRDEFVEGRMVRQKLEKIHLYQLEFYKIAVNEKIGSKIYDWRSSLQKSKDDTGELLRTTARKRALDGFELERLKRAMSYFCAKEYEPNLPADLKLDVSHIVFYIEPTPFRMEYRNFFLC